MEYEIKSPKIKKVDDKFIPIDNIDVLNVYITLKNKNLNVETFRENIKDLVIKDEFDKDGDTSYDYIDNVIYCPKEKYKNSITHELLHAATSIKNVNGVYAGFMYADFFTKDWIGIGLYEGMTAYVDELLFGDYTKEKREIEKYTYQLTKSIIKNLELIIPEETLINYFMNSDLSSFILRFNDLYDDVTHVLEFLEAVDNLYFKFDLPSNVDSKYINDIREDYNKVKTFIAESLYIIVNDSFNNKEISKEDLKYFNSLSKSILNGVIEMNGITYGVKNPREYNKIKKRYKKRKNA